MPFPEIILLVYRFTSFIVVHKQHCLIKEVHDLTCVRTVQYLIHGALSACMCILFSVCVWCQNTITWWKFETRPVSQWVHNPDASKSRWTACLLNLQPINCKLTRHVGVTQLLPCNPVVRSTPSDDQSPWSPFSCMLLHHFICYQLRWNSDDLDTDVMSFSYRLQHPSRCSTKQASAMMSASSGWGGGSTYSPRCSSSQPLR